MIKNDDVKQARERVSQLIFDVLTEKISVRGAITSFPSDSNDPSVSCAWHALVHFEADEDVRLRDKLYAQEQNDYLEMIAHSLKKGEDIPQNIVTGYKEYYEKAMIPKTWDFKNTFKSLFRLII